MGAALFFEANMEDNNFQTARRRNAAIKGVLVKRFGKGIKVSVRTHTSKSGHALTRVRVSIKASREEQFELEKELKALIVAAGIDPPCFTFFDLAAGFDTAFCGAS
jgi:hypothetical protein